MRATLVTCLAWPELSASDRLYADALERLGVAVAGAPWNGPPEPFVGADLVVLRADLLNMQPVHDPVSSVVFQASLANVDAVMVAGRWKKRSGRLVDVDLAPKLAALRASGRKIAAALGLPAHEGSRAIRASDWKLVAASPSLRGRGGGNAQQVEQKPGAWELFNLAEDRAETNNLAEKMPDKVRELAQLWSDKEQEFFKLATQDAGGN